MGSPFELGRFKRTTKTQPFGRKIPLSPEILQIRLTEFGQELGEVVHDADAEPLQSVPVLMAVGNEDAIHAHGVGGFSIMGGIADVDDVFGVEA